MQHQTDMFVIGAGPAGLCAALRLQQLGYRVVLIERSTVWPRSQIGEALTPGVKNIIDYLDANEALANVPHLTRLPTRLSWRSRIAETVAHADAAVVDRSAFDAALLQLAQARGIEVHRPASLNSVAGSAGDWQLSFSTPNATHQVQARMILDARGRQSSQSQQLLCAPRLSALWAEVAENDIPSELAHVTLVEALEQGWLWGTRLPDRRYRVMLLSDPVASRRLSAGRPESWLRGSCGASRLFAGVAQLPFQSPLQMCVATPYMAIDGWQDGRLKIGDAAFALDPISSSGVEKAMRFSLQAAIAIHTFLQAEAPAQQTLAREFYQQRLIETYARHHFWTAAYYRQAWCSEQAFWQERATPGMIAAPGNREAGLMIETLQKEIDQLGSYREPAIEAAPEMLVHQMIRFHHLVQIVSLPCVVGDKVELLPAMRHPHLERPLAFWENEAILPGLGILLQKASSASVLGLLGQSMSLQKARRLLAWLWQRGLVEIASD
ncbi:flavin-dependent monooxygenase QhpG [Collimonas sp.]|jgi:flavin-dependent dehydrogenase|uniref:flavin-dependent monooxygenase QhpG n=1 Tax=Collimonas sp. TaxID=1963772 RepID=UPI002CBA82B4|nr:tryptophan 7-halogenase [Collimonas sp.]HWX02761.1 tryptophan 7-halogenase [Collimonas sp.]